VGISTLMLDTSAYAAFKRGQQEAIDALRQASSIVVPSIVLGELLAGFEVGGRRQEIGASWRSSSAVHARAQSQSPRIRRKDMRAFMLTCERRDVPFPRMIYGSRPRPWNMEPSCLPPIGIFWMWHRSW